MLRAMEPSSGNRRLPEGLVPLIDAIKKLTEELPRFGEKVGKKGGKDSADDRFLWGEWNIVDLVPNAQSILQSQPVLSGGKLLKTGLQELIRHKEKEKERRSRSRSKSLRRSEIKERSARHLQQPRLRGAHRPRLPDSLRVLYGAGEDTERRLFQFMERAQVADEYLQSFRFASCDYCKIGWFGSPLPRPGVCALSAAQRLNLLLKSPDEWDDGGKRICKKCFEEAQKSPGKCPVMFCKGNDMDIGDTFPELDELTFFEEEILAPIQPMVRVYTLYATGMTELRGHVTNVAHGGPQFVREIPTRAHELNILLVRRFSKDPNRKQRVPFIANPKRLTAALDRLEGRLGDTKHLGLAYHNVRVNRDNVRDYPEDAQAHGMQVHEVQQRERLVFDRKLFAEWIGEPNKIEHNLQLNALVRQYLDRNFDAAAASNESDEESGSELDDHEADLSRKWRFVRRAVSQHMDTLMGKR